MADSGTAAQLTCGWNLLLISVHLSIDQQADRTALRAEKKKKWMDGTEGLASLVKRPSVKLRVNNNTV